MLRYQRAKYGTRIASSVSHLTDRTSPVSHAMLSLHRADIYPEQPWFVLSAAQHYSLIPGSHPAISQFYSFEVAPSASLAVPDGCVDILFDCDAVQPVARVCGTMLGAHSAELFCNHRYFGIRFAPGVMPDFLDITACELTDDEFDFLDVVPDARHACEQILNTSLFSQQIALFNTGFTPRLARKSSAVTRSVIRTILQHKGNIRVQQLAALSGYICRTIQRQFRQNTGLSPKAFGRMMRCQAALNNLHLPGNLSCSDLALDLGFSDQSHFLREFKKLVSTTPLDYQRRTLLAAGGNPTGCH